MLVIAAQVAAPLLSSSFHAVLSIENEKCRSAERRPPTPESSANRTLGLVSGLPVWRNKSEVSSFEPREAAAYGITVGERISYVEV